MSNSIHTIFPSAIVPGYFSDENVDFIRNKISEILKREYVQSINIDIASVKRVMERVTTERRESVPKMNQRVIMYLCDEFRNHQKNVQKHLNWEAYYVESQRLYDPTALRGPDTYSIKLNSRLGKPRVGGTMRFYFN